MSVVGETRVSEICSTNPCPVNGSFSVWSEWTECSVTCGGSVQTRYRACNNPLPQYGGVPCIGDRTETKPCALIACTGIKYLCDMNNRSRIRYIGPIKIFFTAVVLLTTRQSKYTQNVMVIPKVNQSNRISISVENQLHHWHWRVVFGLPSNLNTKLPNLSSLEPQSYRYQTCRTSVRDYLLGLQCNSYIVFCLSKAIKLVANAVGLKNLRLVLPVGQKYKRLSECWYAMLVIEQERHSFLHQSSQILTVFNFYNSLLLLTLDIILLRNESVITQSIKELYRVMGNLLSQE